MDRYRNIFNRISYLQYPFMLIGLFYCYRPFFTDLSTLFVEMNKALVFMGLGISFSTLQDTQKVQNNFSKRIYQNPRSTKIFVLVMSGMILFFCIAGLIGLFMSEKNAFSELAFGLISVGIGMIGMLKAAIEMADHQQKQMNS
ncbi:MAG: hypothetical protein EBR30_12675 [Cytophagia bacterium]|nr:hypothetical protein [Cytophagia bacterium]NBW35850.1 hypothetical protein [Cytophagia bacterium]